MPDKSVREMSLWERRRHSLAARTFHAVVAMAVILGLAAVLIGVGMYYRTVSGQYIRNAYSVSAEASAILRETADPADCVEKVMTRYLAMSEEERQDQEAEAYLDRFDYITFDENYRQIMAILKFLRMNNDVEDIYLLALDRENMRVIYIADPEDRPELRCPPGHWSQLREEYMAVFGPRQGDEIPHFVTNNQYGWMCTSGVPVRDRGGNTVGYVLTDISVVGLIRNTVMYLFQFALVLVLLTVLLAYFFVRYFKKTLVNPINRIAGAAETYARDRRTGAENTDHFSRNALSIRTGDEVENLSLVMEDMERDLNEFEADLTKITAEKERINTELSLATRIQAAMLPHIFPPFPGRTELDIYASMDPAKEVGGDFYDFFLGDDDHLCLVMADVSGKGIPAALFMMASKIILQSCAMLGASPAEILTKTNEAICSNNQEEMFVTVWVGILELSTGKLTASNAGHEYPALRSGEGGFALYQDRHGFVLGGMEGMKYRNYELLLSPGDRIFVYTDGVPEATDTAKEMFGTERMLAALNEDPDASPEDILKNVRNAVDRFVRDAEQFDDLTMLCLVYHGAECGEGDDANG